MAKSSTTDVVDIAWTAAKWTTMGVGLYVLGMMVAWRTSYRAGSGF